MPTFPFLAKLLSSPTLLLGLYNPKTFNDQCSPLCIKKSSSIYIFFNSHDSFSSFTQDLVEKRSLHDVNLLCYSQDINALYVYTCILIHKYSRERYKIIISRINLYCKREQEVLVYASRKHVTMPESKNNNTKNTLAFDCILLVAVVTLHI